MMRIIFWENIISQHKLPYWKALAAFSAVSKFVVIVEELLYKKLEQQGWENDSNELETLEVHVNPSEDQISLLLKEDMQNSYHVFSGIRAVPLVFKAFQQSLKYPIHRILLTETINLNGSRALTRRLASFLIERRYQKHYDLVLGSGTSTKDWYTECGVKSDNFFPFLYCIEDIKSLKLKGEITETLKFLFIGQLIKRKGLDILIQALSKVKNPNWTLDIYGTGEEESAILNQIENVQLSDKIKLNGVLSNTELRKIIGQYQVLVLPSRFDGWGAVINEAIASGLKVICSNKCGASILIINDKIGHIFDIHKPRALTKLLEQVLSEKELYNSGYILNYSNYLKGEQVAAYLIAIINFHFNKVGFKPIPPWEKFQLEENSSAINPIQ
jgi:glycosyltransferase involved in cell wall biosynthesis